VNRLVSVTVLLGLIGAALPAVADAGKPRCRGKKATIVGTKHDDRIRGTKKKDVIVLDWEGPNMTQEPNCFSANPCPP
jgi:hypothetical protein